MENVNGGRNNSLKTTLRSYIINQFSEARYNFGEINTNNLINKCIYVSIVHTS